MMEDAACFYMGLLNASGPLVLEGRLREIDALWIRGQTVQAVNQALSDPRRALSRALVYTVSLIVAHEAFFGDVVAAVQIHKPAQRRMLDLTGGIESWDVPDVMKHTFSWLDSAVSAITETPRGISRESQLKEGRFTSTESFAFVKDWWPQQSHKATAESFDLSR